MLDPVTDRPQNDVITGKQNDLNPGSSTRNGAVTQNICRQDGDFFFIFTNEGWGGTVSVSSQR